MFVESAGNNKEVGNGCMNPNISSDQRKLKRFYRRVKLKNRKAERTLCCLTLDGSAESASQYMLLDNDSANFPPLNDMSNASLTSKVIVNKTDAIHEGSDIRRFAKEIDKTEELRAGIQTDICSDGVLDSRHVKDLDPNEQVHNAESTAKLLLAQADAILKATEFRNIGTPTHRARTATSSKYGTNVDKLAEKNRKGRERSLRTRERNIEKLKCLEANCERVEQSNSQIKSLIDVALSGETLQTQQVLLHFMTHVQRSLQSPVNSAIERFSRHLQNKLIPRHPVLSESYGLGIPN